VAVSTAIPVDFPAILADLPLNQTFVFFYLILRPGTPSVKPDRPSRTEFFH